MLQPWMMVKSDYGAHLIAADEVHKRASASAELAALLPKAETSSTTWGTTLRQTLGTLLIRAGQRLHESRPGTREMLPAASR